MKGTIKFYHPDEVLVYHVQKSFCKVVFENKRNTLVVEVESDDNLEHVEEDSYQNEIPQVSLSIEDFEVKAESQQELIGKVIAIPSSVEELENEDGEMVEWFYTNLNVNNKDNLDTDDNEIKFGLAENGDFKMIWTGFCKDFITDTEEPLKFKVSTTFVEEEQDDIEE